MFDFLVYQNVTYSPFIEPQNDYWTWNSKYKSCDAHITDSSCRSVIFHPSWSSGTSAIRGTKILNNTRSFWEIYVNGGLGGTSLMFGIGTRQSCLGTHTFCDLIGKDENSWGLSHRGLLWHKGVSEKYCRPFRENRSATIGLLFDGVYGTLTYFKDGVNLGIAFCDLHKVTEPLYPIISSTSMRSTMTLCRTQQEFVCLRDRCKAVIVQNWKAEDVFSLNLPFKIQNYLQEVDEYRCRDCEWYVPRF